eukprot:g20550.t1
MSTQSTFSTIEVRRQPPTKAQFNGLLRSCTCSISGITVRDSQKSVVDLLSANADTRDAVSRMHGWAGVENTVGPYAVFTKENSRVTMSAFYHKSNHSPANFAADVLASQEASLGQRGEVEAEAICKCLLLIQPEFAGRPSRTVTPCVVTKSVLPVAESQLSACHGWLEQNQAKLYELMTRCQAAQFYLVFAGAECHMGGVYLTADGAKNATDGAKMKIFAEMAQFASGPPSARTLCHDAAFLWKGFPN